MNRFQITFILLVIISQLYSQTKINSKNYYDYYSNGENLKGKSISTLWLTKMEVAIIVREEMKSAGFEWLADCRLIKLDSGNYVVSICYSEKSMFGFIYEAQHGAIPHVKNREIKSIYKIYTGCDYLEKVVSIKGESNFLRIKEIPDNLFLIKEDIYWYQETENKSDNKYLVTKEIIIDILRDDIRLVLKNVKK